MATVKFNQVNGLTVYAFACGYIQSAKFTDLEGVELEVTLRHGGGNCYMVKAHEFGGRGQVHYTATESIGNARKVWAQLVEQLHGERIKAAKADKRYSVEREFCGEVDPHYVARFEGEWLGKSSTAAGAWLLAARDIQQRSELAELTVSNEIKKHMARAFFASAWADARDEAGGSCGGEIMDQMPATIDKAAIHAADTLAVDMCKAHGCYQLENIYRRIEVIQRNTGVTGDRDVTPEMFGHYCAMQAMGSGVGLSDAFGREVCLQITVPYVEFGSHSLELDYFTDEQPSLNTRIAQCLASNTINSYTAAKEGLDCLPVELLAELRALDEEHDADCWELYLTDNFPAGGLWFNYSDWRAGRDIASPSNVAYMLDNEGELPPGVESL